MQTKQIVEDNYAGWFDKVTSENKVAYEDWSQNHQQSIKRITNDSVCYTALQNWISFFKDKHLRVKYSKPKPSSNGTATKTDFEILSTPLTEKLLTDYFENTKNLDPIEGFYESASYKLGISKVKTDLFYATIITTKNENWKAGEVKLTIQKVGENYLGVFYEGDKSDISQHIVQLVDNILDFDIVFYEKVFPEVKTKRDIIEYEMSKDKYAPSLTFENDVAIWKFPSFENNAFEQTEYLLNKYKSSLETTPYWIIDVSNNSGGDYRIGMQLIDYIYTRPILHYNVEMRMTATNFDKWYQYIADYYERADTNTKKALDDRMDKMKANYGNMYNEKGKVMDTLKLEETRAFPQKIALLINENTVSSGELFTMVARQSDKVTVMGTHSGGMMDYGNIVNYRTNCSKIKIQLPINRQLWLDDNFSVDKEGLKPDLYLKTNNWIQQASKIIKNQ